MSRLQRETLKVFLEEIANECDSLSIWLEAEAQQVRSLSPHVLASRWPEERRQAIRRRLGLFKYTLNVPRR